MSRPTHHPTVVLLGGRVIDPSAGCDGIADLAFGDGRIVDTVDADGPTIKVDASGWIICPGMVDMHVHLREPGGQHKETIASGCRAAVAGGFVAVACMPNTQPALDSVDTLDQVRHRAEEAGLCRVMPIATITRGRAGGTLTDFAALKKTGAVALSDDGSGVEDDEVMRAAGRLALETDSLLIQHCEFTELSAGGVMHAGPTAQRLGLPGWDPRAEEAMIERDIELVREIGFRYHAAHISTARGVELVRRAKAAGLPVTTEVCPHHLLLTDEACSSLDPNFKMNPPLRSEHDVAACVAGVVDGTIDCIVTDHAPHAEAEKAVGFHDAPFGIVGLETALPLAARALVEPGLLSWSGLIERMTVHPRRVLGLTKASSSNEGSLDIQMPADLTIFDPESEWTIDAQRFRTMGRNTPFNDWAVRGQVMATLVDGRLRFVHSRAADRFSMKTSA
ncbi:MAG: dihydroorotase [Planctomycetes bacterium]|nr:dihydroorotase [Planctomycetota bacterium]